MNKKYKKLIEITKALRPKKKTTNRYFHAAFILHNKKILSIGWNNTTKSHPSIKKYPYHEFAGTHAEMAAIIKMKRQDCDGMTMIVIRVNKNGDLRNSKPCAGCRALIAEKHFDEVWFSTENNSFEKLNQ
jgi:tRNA(Arg) A34 adenosine deaminase TadA